MFKIFSKTLKLLAVIFFVLVAIAIIIKTTTFDTSNPTFLNYKFVQMTIYLVLSIVVATIPILIFRKFRSKLGFLSKKSGQITTLLFLSLLTRILWVLATINATDRVVFSTYHTLAKDIANGIPVSSWYYAVFPHVIGYPLILSVPYKILGATRGVAIGLNVIFSVLTILLIYFMVSLIKDNCKHGFIVALLYIFFPTGIFYVALPSSEIIFTFLFLATILIFILILKSKTLENKKILPVTFFILLALSCLITNFVRPLGLVPIVAFIIIYTLNICHLNFKKAFIKTALFIIVFAGTYFLLYQALAIGLSKFNHQEIARSPFGFNLLVGGNISAGGGWNETDSKRLESIKTLPAQKIHDQLFSEGLTRYKHNGVRNLGLFVSKFGSIWGTSDSGFMSHAYNKQAWDTTGFDKYAPPLLKISFCYYSLIILICIVFAVKTFQQKNIDVKILLLFLLLFGIATVHLIMETMARYNFPSVSIFVIIAGIQLASWLSPKQNNLGMPES